MSIMPTASLYATWFRIATLLVVAMWSAWLAGCVSERPDAPLPEPTGQLTPIPAVGAKTDGILIVDQIYILRQRQLEPILAEVAEGAAARLDDTQRATWNANELQAVRLNAVELSQFYKAIDKGSSMRRNRHAITKHDLLLETTPELARPIVIDWATKPNLDRTLRMPAGRTRFLGQLKLERDHASITLTPQHHWVRQTLIPRAPLEKVRDGRIFHELTLTAALPPNEYLVIYWHPSPEDSDDQSGDANQPEVPGEPDAAPDTHTPPTPNTNPNESPENDIFKLPLPPPQPRLGRLLLTGQRANKALQLILVIHSPARVGQVDNARPTGGDGSPTPDPPPDLKTDSKPAPPPSPQDRESSPPSR